MAGEAPASQASREFLGSDYLWKITTSLLIEAPAPDALGVMRPLRLGDPGAICFPAPLLAALSVVDIPG